MFRLRSTYLAFLLIFFPLSVYAQNINPTATTPSIISTNGTYSFTWTAGRIRGISPYYVWLYEDSNPIRLSYPSQGSTLKHQGEYTFRNRTKGSRTYYIKACMTNDNRDCRYSSRTTVTVRAVPVPYKVSGLHLTGGDGQVDLSWRAQTNISRYDIRYSLPRVYGGSVVVTTNRGTVKNLSDGQWEFDVRACNTDNVCGPWSDKQSKTIAKRPGIPTSFKSNESPSYDGSYTLSWGSSANTVTRYEWREKTSTGSWSAFNSTGTSRSVHRIKNNGTYNYQVRGCNNGGCGGVHSLTVTVDKNIAPTANRSTSSSSTGGYSISWNAGRYKGQVPQYVWLYEGSNAIRLSYPSQGSSIKSSGTYQLRHTSQGTRNYYLRTCLTASSQCVNSRTTSVKVDFPAPPKVGTVNLGNSEGSYDTNGRIDTTWAGVSHAKRYEIHYGLRGKSKTTVSSNSANRSFSGLADGIWEFQVRACNQANECGTWSNLRAKHVLRVPGVPSSFTSNESPSYDGSYTLSWGTAANSVAYYGWREQVNGGSWSSFSSTGTGRALNRVKNNGTYSYHVHACNAAGCSGVRSLTVKVDKNIAPTITPNVGNVATGGFSINWQAGRYLGQVPSYVWLYQGSKATRLSYPSQGSTLKHQGEYFITDVSQGTKAYYIRTCLQANSQCVNSAARNITVDFPTPPKLRSLTLSNSEGTYDINGRVDVTLSSLPGAKSYQIRYGIAGQNKTQLNNVPLNKSFTGLADGRWEFEGRACNQAAECGPWSDVVSKQVLKTPGTPPSFSSNESPSLDGHYILRWNASAGTVSRYEWREKTSSKSNWPGFSNNKSLRHLERNNPNGTYDYQVRACNAGSCGGVTSLSVLVSIPVPTATPYPRSSTAPRSVPTPMATPVITSESGASIASPAMANYTLYYGDFNSDGRVNDIYFVGAGSLRDFVYYQNSDGSHRDAVVLTSSSNTLSNATLLTFNQDYFIHHFDADGIPDFLIRGKTVHDVTLMLRGVANFANALPGIIVDFTGSNALDYNLSDRNLLLDFVDYNNQNIVDIRVRSSSGGAGTVVYVGNPSVSLEDDFDYDYGYDELRRLRKVKLNEQDRTQYDYDPAGNRTSVNEIEN